MVSERQLAFLKSILYLIWLVYFQFDRETNSCIPIYAGGEIIAMKALSLRPCPKVQTTVNS